MTTITPTRSARYLSRFWTEEVFKHETPTGRRYRGGYLSWNYWIAYAPSTAATPDGRKRGTFLSNGLCPVDGTDRQGPTAVAISVGKLGLETAPNGDSHTISFNPSLLRGAERVGKLAAYLRGYGEKGGTALQINVIDPETLKLAQAEPVRVLKPSGARDWLQRVLRDARQGDPGRDNSP